MLYDKRWDAKPETKPDVFSLESLIAWLETMPAAGRYNYFCMGECLIGQWLKTFDADAREDLRNDHIDGPFHYIVNGHPINLIRFEDIAQGDVGMENNRRWTFGAALTRARKALSDQQSRGDADTSRETV